MISWSVTFGRFRLVGPLVNAWDLLRAARLDETVDPWIVGDVLKMVEKSRLLDWSDGGITGAADRKDDGWLADVRRRCMVAVKTDGLCLVR